MRWRSCTRGRLHGGGAGGRRIQREAQVYKAGCYTAGDLRMRNFNASQLRLGRDDGLDTPVFGLDLDAIPAREAERLEVGRVEMGRIVSALPVASGKVVADGVAHVLDAT